MFIRLQKKFKNNGNILLFNLSPLAGTAQYANAQTLLTTNDAAYTTIFKDLLH